MVEPDAHSHVSEAAVLLRQMRARSGLSLRALARRAGTSHSTLAAYEAGRKTPSAGTLDRILAGCGMMLGARARRAVAAGERAARGAELAEVLRLAERFPSQPADQLQAPRFGRE